MMLEFTKHLTKEAGKKMFGYYKSQTKNEVYEKSSTDFALAADLEVEAYIMDEIKKKFPTHAILSEEDGESGPQSEYKWIVDPIDGTANFRQRIPYFCTTIALQYKGQIIIAAAYNPNSNELFIAEKGKGAFVNDQKISVSKKDDLRKFFISYSTSNHKNSEAVTNGSRVFKRALEKCSAVRLRGSSILDLCNLSKGVFDALVKVEASYWDFAAGCLIVEEAGGIVTDWDGKQWDESTNYIIASNGQIHSELSQALLS